MNISSLAKAAGITTDTLRYYEKLGLLDEPQRAENGYRRYAEHHISRVRFIRSAQSLGFSLTEIGSIIPQMAAGQFDRTQIEQGLLMKIGQIDTHIKELQQLKKNLQSTFKMLNCERNVPISESSASLTVGSTRTKVLRTFAG